MNQSNSNPVWKLIANLGEKDYIYYGGYFVYEDATGVYPEEVECVEPLYLTDLNKTPLQWEIYRFVLERCTYINGVLSDNQYPPEHPAWFADELESVASTYGINKEELIEDFCSEDPIKRANAYLQIGEYFGMQNFDAYPIILNNRLEVEARYANQNVLENN